MSESFLLAHLISIQWLMKNIKNCIKFFKSNEYYAMRAIIKFFFEGIVIN